jgi:hypothetical protein
VAAPRRRLPLLRLAALPEARAERRADGGVENGFYVRGMPAETCLATRRKADKKARKSGEGSSRPLPSTTPTP